MPREERKAEESASKSWSFVCKKNVHAGSALSQAALLGPGRGFSMNLGL